MEHVVRGKIAILNEDTCYVERYSEDDEEGELRNPEEDSRTK